MIQLAAPAAGTTSPWAHLTNPPTHAMLVSAYVAHVVDPPHYTLRATYNFGTVAADGTWTTNPYANAVVVELPKPFDATGAVDQTTALAGLFGAEVAPDPANPIATVAVPKKKAGDWKIADVDAIATWAHPMLAGTVV